MKIIGKTEDGATIVVISTEEIINLCAASQTLNEFVRNQIPIKVVSDASPAAEPVARHDVARPAHKKVGRRPPAEPSERVGKKRLCLWCQKPLPANSRRKTHKGECNKLWTRKQSREWFRAKHNVKNPRKFEDKESESAQVQSGTNPANPFLSDAERETMKTKRLATLKTLAEKHKYDDAT